jgi:hypothetical protein
MQGEKNYTDNLKEQAFQNFDTVKRNLEKQNKILNTEIRSLMGAESLVDEDLVASRSYAKDRPFNPLGWGSDPSAPETKRLAEYRKQGLKLVDDVATRPRHSADPTRLDYRLQPDQGGLSTTDEGEIVMVAETELIPVKYKQVDRHALSKFEHLDQSDIVSAAKKEARQERITDQIKYQSPDERLEDLKRKNLDFDTLMNEMAKECRHIYEDEIGIRPIKRGEGVDTLDQIIDNLYNDDFKVKNLPPKTKTTTTEPAQTSPIDNHPKNTDKKPSTFSLHHGAGQASQGDRPHARVLVSPENLFDSFGGNDSTQHEKKPSPNPFLLDSYAEDRPPSGDQESHRLPQFATTSPPHHLSANNSELSPGHLSPGPSNGKPKGKQDASGFDNTAVSGQLSFGQPGTDRHGEMSFADPLKKDASRLSEAKKTGDEEDQIEQGSHREEIEAEEEGEEAGEEGGEEAEEEDQQEDADVEDEEQASEGSVHEEVEEEADEKADRNDGKNSRHSKNSSLGDDGRPNKPGESKVLGGQGNADASRAEDLRKSDSKKKVTFSSEIENKNHK